MRNFMNFLAAVLLCLVCAGPANAQHDKYFFITLTGRAVLSRTSGSTWLSLQQAQPVEVKPGDMINVEGDGRGELRFPDGSSVRMKNNAMITIMRYGINQRLGNVWLNVRRSSDIFKVVTPLGSCSVLGTSFDVDVDRYGKTKVRVFSGLVAVRAAEDSRNRQLVLQPGMHTTLSEKTKVADKPEKFQAQTIEISLNSEWEARNFATAAPSALEQTRPLQHDSRIPPALQPAAPAPGSAQAIPARPTMPEVQPGRVEAPPVGPLGGSSTGSEATLPPIRPELQSDLQLPSAGDVIKGIEPSQFKDGEIMSLARQRAAFLEMLRQQKIDRDSVIGGSFKAREEMAKDLHGQESGQRARLSFSISDNESLDRENWLVRNRLLRVQSQLRQKELEIADLIRQNITTPSHQRKISNAQAQLIELQTEQRVLSDRIRDVQTKKR